MTYRIRPVTPADEPFLWEMLYYAAQMADDGAASPEDAKRHPFLATYVTGWGRAGDMGVIAVEPTSHQPIGAAWIRVLTGTDHTYPAVDENTPELAIAVRPSAIGGGAGTQLLTQLLADASAVYPAVVLSVRAANPARRLYERLGFVVVDEVVNRVGGRSFVMLANLRSR
jgi:ribosomal protein S18 acetylase RimI-like enzyme